jgi:hypothetical protein
MAQKNHLTKSFSNGLFGSVVAVAFQIAFHVEMHQNTLFKIIFEINVSKRSKTYKKLIFSTNFLETHFQTGSNQLMPLAHA